jgi:hypothetical protein
VKAIETSYKGYRFRSRLEARWAVFLDAIGARWDYEPEGYELPSGWYLPDFFVHFRDDDHDRQRYRGAGYWLEVKPIQPSDHERQLVLELARATGHVALIGVGVPGTSCMFLAGRNSESCHLTDFSEFRDPGVVCLSLRFGRCAHIGSDGFFLADERTAINAARAARFEART